MALIKIGSINNFRVTATTKAVEENSFLESITTFSELTEVSDVTPTDVFEFATSTDARGIAISSLKLNKGFQGFLSNLLNATNNIYFIAWAWDMSGQPINMYPGEGFESKDVLIPMKVGSVREFLGNGIPLFPKRVVKGGIAVRIQIWESDHSTRSLGETISESAEAIEKSELNKLLSVVSLAAGVSGASVTLIKNAAIELAKVVGTILKTNGDDYVDYFEGYYTADQEWQKHEEVYTGNASVLSIEKF